MMFTPFAFIKQSRGSSVYEILLSGPGPDNKVCAVGPEPTPRYTTDNTFQIGSIIYTKPDLSTPFKGGKLYYSVYDSNEDPYGIWIVIDNLGAIFSTGICK